MHRVNKFFFIFVISIFFLIFTLIINVLLKYQEPLNIENIKKVILETSNNKMELPNFDNVKMDELLENITSDFKSISGEITYQSNIIGDKYYSILFTLPNNEYKSFIIDLKKIEVVDIANIFKNKNNDFFNEKIITALKDKYPYFIYDKIINSNGIDSFLILNNEIYVYFSNYDIIPKLNEKIFVRINNHEIFEYLDIPYTLDEVYINQNIYALDPNKKTIVLTFDDGPNASTTSEMIEILKQNHSTATFFMLGSRMTGNERLITNLINYGNEVGNHSYSHKFLTRISSKEMNYEISATNEKYKSITQKDIKYFRVPYGSLNETVRTSINIPIISWDIDTLDWKNKDAEVIKNKVLEEINDGDIILMHDIHKTTVEAVRILLPELYIRNYQIVSVTNYLNLYNITLEKSMVYRKLK